MSGPVAVIVERDGAWVRLVLDTPPGNLLSLDMVQALRRAVAEAATRRAAVKWLTVEGRAGEFSFGADIGEHLPGPMREVLPAMHALVRELLVFPAPTAAIVEGRCLGGGFEIALACDDILATATAVLGLPEISLAAFPPVGALLLPRRVGVSRATRAVVTGVAQSATFWHEAGLVSLVPRRRAVREVAGEWFDKHFAPRSAVGLGFAARAARALLLEDVERLLGTLERLYLDELLVSHDATEGVRAFLEKRPPRWRDA